MDAWLKEPEEIFTKNELSTTGIFMTIGEPGAEWYLGQNEVLRFLVPGGAASVQE